MNLTDLLASAKTFAGAVSSDPGRYAGALKSGLEAIAKAKDVIEKLHGAASSADPAQAAHVSQTLDGWAAVAATIEADKAVQDELAKDAAALTLDEVAEAIGLLVKVGLAVGKVAAA